MRRPVVLNQGAERLAPALREIVPSRERRDICQAEQQSDIFLALNRLPIKQGSLITPVPDGTRCRGDEFKRASHKLDCADSSTRPDNGSQLYHAFDPLPCGILWVSRLTD